MSQLSARKFIALFGVFFAVWLCIRYLLPIAFPFLLGTMLALAAEPVVRMLSSRFGMRRGFASGIGVSAAVVLFLGILFLLASVFIKELGHLADGFPNIEETVRQGMALMQDFLLSLTGRTPAGIQPLLERTVLSFFSGGTAFMDQLTRRLPSLISGILSHVPDGFLSIGTGLISGFMISARLPKLKNWLQKRLPASWKEKYLPMLRSIRSSLGGWLKAQLKLSGMTFLIVTVGLLVLQVPYAPLWAVGVALVDAVPILGTGTVLLPWALVSLLQDNSLRAIGLLGVYAITALLRSILEPRLVGKQLGLDPLITLVALYAGYQIWGIGGMILAPLLAVTAMQLAAGGHGPQHPRA